MSNDNPKNIIEIAKDMQDILEYRQVASLFLYMLLSEAERFTLRMVKERGTIGNLKQLTEPPNYQPYRTLIKMDLIKEITVKSGIRFALTNTGVHVANAGRINAKMQKERYIMAIEESTR